MHIFRYNDEGTERRRDVIGAAPKIMRVPVLCKYISTLEATFYFKMIAKTGIFILFLVNNILSKKNVSFFLFNRK